MKNNISKESFNFISENVDQMAKEFDLLRNMANKLRSQLHNTEYILENSIIEDDPPNENGWTKLELLKMKCHQLAETIID